VRLWRDGVEKSRVDRREGSEYSASCIIVGLLLIDLHGSGKRFSAKLEC
jgi:hypothetical protein